MISRTQPSWRLLPRYMAILYLSVATFFSVISIVSAGNSDLWWIVAMIAFPVSYLFEAIASLFSLVWPSFADWRTDHTALNHAAFLTWCVAVGTLWYYWLTRSLLWGVSYIRKITKL